MFGTHEGFGTEFTNEFALYPFVLLSLHAVTDVVPVIVDESAPSNHN
jgi:hypothetical protein